MFEVLRRYRREKQWLRNSMRDLARNGYYCAQIHGDVTLAQKLHTRLFGH